MSCNIVRNESTAINRLPGARRSLTCDPRSYYDRKLVVLQYLQNSSTLTRQQRYAQIANGEWTNRTTSWASQSQLVTNPNTKNLLRSQYIFREIQSNRSIECSQPFIQIDYSVLPPHIDRTVQYDPIIVPPPVNPNSGSSTNVIPIISIPIINNISVYRSGGVLICSEKDKWCPLV